MGLESPVSQLKAVPSSDMGNARASAAPKLAGEPIFAPMDERQLAQWELMTDQLLSGDQARPWHVRHARKLIGGAAVLVVAGLAFFSYSAWRLPAVPAVPAAPIPVTVLPESAPVPAAAPAPVAAPAPGPRYRPGPIRPPPVSTQTPAVEPAASHPGDDKPRESSRRSSRAAVDGSARSGRHPYAARRARAHACGCDRGRCSCSGCRRAAGRRAWRLPRRHRRARSLRFTGT